MGKLSKKKTRCTGTRTREASPYRCSPSPHPENTREIKLGGTSVPARSQPLCCSNRSVPAKKEFISGAGVHSQ